jgi:hypothetical protein
MLRYISATALGCLYVAGAIWVVQSAGEEYRNRLIKEKLAASDIKRTTPTSPQDRDQLVAVAAVLEDSSTRPSLPAPVAPRANSSPSATAKELFPSNPATSAPTDRADARPPIMLAVDANPLEHNPFWNQVPLKRVWDISALKLDEERRLGAEFHDLVVQLNLLVENGPWLSRVEDAAEPFYDTLRRKDIKYKFSILNSDAVNAFSTPGGYIYASRGLFDLISEEEEYALQFAIGHEIAHVDLQHAIHCLRDPDVKKMTQGTLQKLYWLIIPFGYLASDKVDQEYEADEWVASRMQRFGKTRREILIFLQKLDGYAKTRGFEDGRIQPQRGRDVSPLENHYRAQTAARKRLKHLKEFIDQPAHGPK